MARDALVCAVSVSPQKVACPIPPQGALLDQRFTIRRRRVLRCLKGSPESLRTGRHGIV